MIGARLWSLMHVHLHDHDIQMVYVVAIVVWTYVVWTLLKDEHSAFVVVVVLALCTFAKQSNREWRQTANRIFVNRNCTHETVNMQTSCTGTTAARQPHA